MFLQYHWLVGRTTIGKFVPKICHAFLAEFQEEYLTCPNDLEDWKKVQEKFKTRWFICLFGVLRRFQHCTGHITTGSWKGRGNQYI